MRDIALSIAVGRTIPTVGAPHVGSKGSEIRLPCFNFESNHIFVLFYNCRPSTVFTSIDGLITAITPFHPKKFSFSSLILSPWPRQSPPLLHRSSACQPRRISAKLQTYEMMNPQCESRLQRLLLSRTISSGPTRRSRTVPDGKQSSKHIQKYVSPPHFRLFFRELTRTIFQVTKLCGPEPLTKYVVLGVVSLQICCAYLLRETSFFSWRFWLTAYVIGATSNQNLFLAIHEISHNLAFRSPMANRLLAIFANLPIGLPYSAAFRVCIYQTPLIRNKKGN